jgi:ATP-dependent DNA helicase RecG
MATTKKTAPPSGSIRTVGPLGIFGIRDMWRLPMILPKKYWDLSRPDISLTNLQVGQYACVGGDALQCRLMTVAECGLAPPSEDTEDDDGTPVCEDIDAGDNEAEAEALSPDDADDSASAQPLTDPDSDDNPDEAFEVSGGLSAPERWTFELVGSNSRARLTIEIEALTKAHIATIEQARRGEGLYVYGRIDQDGERLVMRGAAPVEESSIGIIHARYPSKSKKVLKPVTVKTPRRGPKGRRKTKWIIHKLTPDHVAGLIRERLQYATRKFGVAIRERLGITSKRSEWDLLRKFESPAINFEGLVHQAHFPRTIEDGHRAIRALERLSALEVMIEIERGRVTQKDEASRIRCTSRAYRGAIDTLRANSGIRLSAEQEFACREILADLASDVRQHRFLSGDVGTGKTLVFGVAAATIYASRKLTVILEPTSNLAEQVHSKLSRYWPDIPMMLITGTTKSLDLPSAGIIVGTTGVWSRLLKTGGKPDWIIADEQHKFGTTQRQPWLHSDTNILEATATPIPRTQGLVEFNGIDVSYLTHCHVAKNIETILAVGDFELEHVYEEAVQRIQHEGGNLILVFPLIERREEDDGSAGIPASISEAKQRWSQLFADAVAIIHGRVDDIEKSGALAAFERGEIKVLIGTTILEVGIDFSHANQMIIHHPERLGVASVHQLRGRLARQGGDAWCYLATDRGVGQDQMDLLALMTTEKDGLKLAVRDMQRRGFGDLRKHANQQSGTYSGILVDREPDIEDISMVLRECKRWITGETISINLFGDDDEDRTHTMAVIGKASTAPELPLRAPRSTAPQPVPTESLQLQMF